MSVLASQRCLHHTAREAVARCTQCRQSYCRECIVEHEERVLCAGCAKKLLSTGGQKTDLFRKLVRGTHLVLSFMLLWIVFFALGRILLAIPSSFHEGDFWKLLHLPP